MSTKHGQYPFNRDSLASTRLNLQHQLWVASTRNYLSNAIEPANDALIADIGCGTGIWSLQLSSQPLLGDCKIEAFDISLAQAPHKAWTPSNITFSELDILADLPEGLVGRYDIVHIRLFQLVVQDGDPLPLLKNLMKLLKPGGYLHWQEYDSAKDYLRVADPDRPAPKLQALRADFARMQYAFDNSWISSMHEQFEQHGGRLVKHEKCWTADEFVGIKQDITFLAAREYCANLRLRDAQSKDAVHVAKLCEEAEKECWELGRGAFIDTEMVTWVVQKY